MAISPSASRCARTAGFTLFETLVALAIASSVAAAAAAFVRVNTPGPAMTALVDATAGDFRRARLEARRSGHEVGISVDEAGYAIPALGITRRWDEAVEARWSASARTGFALYPGPVVREPVRLELARSGLSAQILVQPISGRVDVRRE